ncbi:unnamed protein product, partial [Acidithrix sp. C25]
VAHRYIEHVRTLEEAVRFLSRAELVAIDTEFHRERSYFAKLALVQIAADDEVFLIDPLRVDLAPLAEVFESDAEAVFHAANQDLEILNRKVGTVPNKFFDTQIASGFLGYSTPSLGSLVEQFLGIELDKSDRLSDWLVRPLEENQLKYAAQDVLYLVDLRDAIVDAVVNLDRLDWLVEELGDYISQDFSGMMEPNRAWQKIREIRGLKGRSKQVAIAVAAWRETRAIEEDRPPRFILADLAIATIAQNLPKRVSELKALRGVDSRSLLNGADIEIISVVAKALEAQGLSDEEMSMPDPIELPGGAAVFLNTWLTSRAKQLKIDANLLGSRSDIIELFGSVPQGRLSKGWRKLVVGDYVDRLMKGEIALALGANGEIEMVENSGEVIH